MTVKAACSEFREALPGTSGVPSVSSNAVAQFLQTLFAVFERNTPQNIQTCTKWILQYVTQSPQRTEILGEFLVSLSESMIVDEESTPNDVIRNRMDLVLAVNDVLHAAKFHPPSSSTSISAFKAYAEELVKLAASCIHGKNTKNVRTLGAIIKFWEVNDIFEAEDIHSIIDSARKALKMAQRDGLPIEKRVDTLPRWFGDRNASWADLPASYTLATTVKYGDQHSDSDGINDSQGLGQRSSSRARDYNHHNDLNRIKARGYSGKRPSLRIRNLLDEYFAKVDSDPRPTADTVSTEGGHEGWINSMGLPTSDNGIPDSRRKDTNGYGWSISVCKSIEDNGFVEAIATEAEERQTASDHRGNDENIRDYDYHGSRSPKRRRSLSSGSEDSRPRRRSRGRSLSRSSYDSRDERSSSRRRDRIVREPERQPRYDNAYDNGHSRFHDNTRGPNRHRVPPNLYTRGPSTSTGDHEDPYVPMAQATNPVPAGYPIQAPPFPGPMAMPPFPPPPFPGAPIPGMSGPMNFGGFPNNAYPQMGGNGYPGQFGNNNPQGYNPGYGNVNGTGFQGNNFNAPGGYQGNNQRGRGRGSGWQ